MLSASDERRIADAIRSTEQTTSGEIVCVLARTSSDYTNIPTLWVALISLIVPWPLILFTQYSVQRIYILELITFLVLMLMISPPALRLRLVPRAVQRAHAHRAAMEQFMIRGLARTKERTGVLIFVSMAERYARIVADDGIAAKIPQREWQGIVDRLVEESSAGRVADGFVRAVTSCGAHLAAHFPHDPASINQLPDRIYVI